MIPRPNVMITSVGRRNLLLRYFREALHGRGELLAADMSSCAPALQEADRSFIVPPVASPSYIDTLITLCSHNNVGLILSVNDLELPLLAAAKDRFRQIGTTPVVPDLSIVELCFDKLRFFEAVRDWGLPVPTTFTSVAQASAALDSHELDFPIIVKPRWGTASMAVEIVHDIDELSLAFELVCRRSQRSIIGPFGRSDPDRQVLIQEHIKGQEFGLDIVNDLLGVPQAVLVRRKLAMRAGETDRACTAQIACLEELGLKLARRLAHPGVIDCDVFLTESGPVLLELNARFGGGYPFSQLAGADVPGALVDWMWYGRTTRSLAIRPNLTAAKTDGIIVIKEGAE